MRPRLQRPSPVAEQAHRSRCADRSSMKNPHTSRRPLSPERRCSTGSGRSSTHSDRTAP
ncbi:hypothetical protein GS506_22880 [Rhodococcus hoagii]|nr:hypothetical protein [Prescottella equi]